jgi:hypothetical protein
MNDTMQTEKKVKDPVSSRNKNASQEASAHFVYISDESGIITAFEQIKSKLSSELNGCLTLIYSTPVYLSQPLFRAELESLERRFQSRLITHYVFNRNPRPSDNPDTHQRILEIVINSNICRMMQFSILGHEEFAGMIAARLQFLGIKTNQISSQII